MILDKKELVEYFYANRQLFNGFISRFGLESDDIIQDCCLKILESDREYYNLYNGQRENYLKRFVGNHCKDIIKKHKKTIGLSGIDIKEDDVDYTGFLDVVNNSHLSLIRKQVIYNRFWRDLTYKQSGEELNVNECTLKSAFRRSKNELKLLLQ